MKRRVLSIFCLVLFFTIFFCCFSCVQANFSYNITTKYGKSAKSAKIEIVDAWNVQRNYKIYKQTSIKSKYIKNHGCGTSCLTTILHSYNVYNDKGPAGIHKHVESAYFPSYYNNKMPLGLCGMNNILYWENIPYYYNYTTTERSNIQSTLYYHLVNGRPAIVLLKKNKKYYCAKYVKGHHYILLLGYIESGKYAGKVIVADTSGKYPRIHFEKLSHIVKCMELPKPNKSVSYYYHSGYNNGGYILIY